LFYQFNPLISDPENPPDPLWKSVAYSPNTANLQWVDSNQVNAKPFGPRNASNADVLEEGIQAVLPGQSLFLDDWNSFHIHMGEVHCGSAAEREAEEDWWNK